MFSVLSFSFSFVLVLFVSVSYVFFQEPKGFGSAEGSAAGRPLASRPEAARCGGGELDGLQPFAGSPNDMQTTR
jgi:hypothetical protein